MHTGLNTFAIFEDYQEGVVLSCGYNPVVIIAFKYDIQHFILYLALSKEIILHIDLLKIT